LIKGKSGNQRGFNLPKKILKERIEIILQTFPALSREEREGARSRKNKSEIRNKFKIQRLKIQNKKRPRTNTDDSRTEKQKVRG